MATLQVLRYSRIALGFRARFHSAASSREQYNNTTKAVFEQVVVNGPDDRVVLVDFYADWCGPCHALSPILRELTKNRTTGSGRELDLLTMDVDNESNGGFELSQNFKVRALPTVFAFRGGKPIDKFVGALNEAGVEQFLDKL